MSIIRNPYSNAKIAQLRQLLYNNKESGKPIEYEIRIDELRVVPRTSDPEQFDNHEEFIDEHTQSVHVILYEGISRKNTRYIFNVKEEPKQEIKQPILSGVEVDKMVSDKISQERKQWKQEQLEKENQTLKAQLGEADDYINKLQTAIEEMKAKRMKLGDVHWGEIASVALEGLMRRNTHLLAKIPGAEGLAGIIAHDNKEPKQLNEIETEASFKKKETGSETVEFEKINEEDKKLIDFLKQLQEAFSEEELKNIMLLLNLFVDKPKAIEPAIAFTREWKEAETKQEEPLKEESNQTEEQPITNN